MILLVQVPDLNTYRENPELILDRSHVCPACGHRPLARHDARSRWVYTATEKVRCRIFRMRCGGCGGAVTLLPNFLVPRFRYVATVIQQAISDYLTSPISYRGLAVKISGTVLPDDSSATDALLSVQLRPSYQRIHAWVNHLARIAASSAQTLATWLLRLRPDSHLLHLFATPLPAFDAKARSEAKRLGLRAAALLRVFVHEVPELSGAMQPAWLVSLSTMTRRIQGRPPLRDPPST